MPGGGDWLGAKLMGVEVASLAKRIAFGHAYGYVLEPGTLQIY